MPVGETKRSILERVASSNASWSELLAISRVSEPVLAGHLKDLQQRDLIRKGEQDLYEITDSGIRFLELESAKLEAEMEYESVEDILGTRELGKALYTPSRRLRIYARNEFEQHDIRRTISTMGFYGVMAIKAEMLGPLKGVEGAYADLLQHLLIDSVKVEEGQAFFAAGGALARRSAAADIWSLARGFVDQRLGFDYSSAFGSNMGLLKQLTSKLEKEDGKKRQWDGLRERLENDCKEVLPDTRVDQSAFPLLLAWLRIKEYLLGWKLYSRVREVLLIQGMEGCGLINQEAARRILIVRASRATKD